MAATTALLSGIELRKLRPIAQQTEEDGTNLTSDMLWASTPAVVLVVRRPG